MAALVAACTDSTATTGDDRATLSVRPVALVGGTYIEGFVATYEAANETGALDGYGATVDITAGATNVAVKVFACDGACTSRTADHEPSQECTGTFEARAGEDLVLTPVVYVGGVADCRLVDERDVGSAVRCIAPEAFLKKPAAIGDLVDTEYAIVRVESGCASVGIDPPTVTFESGGSWRGHLDCNSQFDGTWAVSSPGHVALRPGASTMVSCADVPAYVSEEELSSWTWTRQLPGAILLRDGDRIMAVAVPLTSVADLKPWTLGAVRPVIDVRAKSLRICDPEQTHANGCGSGPESRELVADDDSFLEAIAPTSDGPVDTVLVGTLVGSHVALASGASTDHVTR